MNTFRLPLLLLLLLAVTCSQQDQILGPTPGGIARAFTNAGRPSRNR